MVQILGVLGSAHSKGLISRESGEIRISWNGQILKELKGSADGHGCPMPLLRGGIGMAWTPANGRSLATLVNVRMAARLGRRAPQNIGELAAMR